MVTGRGGMDMMDNLQVLTADLAPGLSPCHPVTLSPCQGETAVACRGVTKVFGQGDSQVQALAGIDVEMAAGELTLLVGPSGCGKTTLISVIAGLLDPTEGEVAILGTNLTWL